MADWDPDRRRRESALESVQLGFRHLKVAYQARRSMLLASGRLLLEYRRASSVMTMDVMIEARLARTRAAAGAKGDGVANPTHHRERACGI